MQPGSVIPKLIIPRKYERDVDMLLAEEFSISTDFGAWFLGKTRRFQGVKACVVGVEVSKSDNLGESDLVVTFRRDDTGGRFALLIEDKIDAPVMPNQLERYRLRAERYKRNDVFEDYEIVLCSPDGYVNCHPEMGSCDCQVSYEAIASEYFEGQAAGASRSTYRATFLREAAQSAGHSAFKQIEDETTKIFWDKAYLIALRDFPELEMREPHFTKGQTWIDFRPLEMKTGLIRTVVSLKGQCGFADFTFSGIMVREFQPSIMHILEKDMTVHQTGKSTAIRLCVPVLEVGPWDNKTEERIRTAFTACTRLIGFYRTNKSVLLDASVRSSNLVLA